MQAIHIGNNSIPLFNSHKKTYNKDRFSIELCTDTYFTTWIS